MMAVSQVLVDVTVISRSPNLVGNGSVGPYVSPSKIVPEVSMSKSMNSQPSGVLAMAVATTMAQTATCIIDECDGIS